MGQYFLTLMLMHLIVTVTCTNDPCANGNHREFPTDNIGARNEGCMSNAFEECDRYFNQTLWYTSSVGKLLTHCPQDRSCGTPLPAWIYGSYPSETEGVVNRTVCIKREATCCYRTLTMEIKNCSTFAVFRLPNVPSCPSAYCFESNLPCETTTKTTQTLHNTGPPTTAPNENCNQFIHKSEHCNDSLVIGMFVGGGFVFVCITTGIVLYAKFVKKSQKVSTLPQHVMCAMHNIPPIYTGDGLPSKGI